jgi:hypothetical protein
MAQPGWSGMLQGRQTSKTIQGRVVPLENGGAS